MVVKASRVKLTELDAEITSVSGRPQENDCLLFICPTCRDGHGIMVSFIGPSLYPSGAMWEKSGSGLEDLTISPSINCDYPLEDGSRPCRFHGFVRDGWVEFEEPEEIH